MSDYKKQTWVDEETLVDAEHLNHMEDGIEGAQNTTDEALETAQSAQSTADSATNLARTANTNANDALENAEAAQNTADSALAKANEVEGEIPTKVSQLDNDSGYITDSALDGYAKESAVESVKETADSALEKATETAESAITGINVNGTAQPVNDNIAELTIEEGGGAIEKIEVNGEEQPIVDKTVNLDIDRASVEDETLIVGDTTGGSSHIVTGVVTESEIPKQISFDNPIFVVATDAVGTSAWGVNPDGDYKEICENADAHFDGNTLSVGDIPCTYFAILED